MAARNEVLAVEVERDRAELERLRAEAAADLAEANLQRLLELPPATRVEPGEPLEASAPPLPDLEALVAEAQAGRAERKALAARVRGRGGGRRGGARRAAAPGRSHRRLHLRQPQPRHRAPHVRLDGHVGRRAWASRGTSSTGEGARPARPGRERRPTRPARSCASSTARCASRSRSARSSCAPPGPGSRSPSGASARPRESRRVAADRYREGVIASSELLDAELAHERAALARTEARGGAAALRRRPSTGRSGR